MTFGTVETIEAAEVIVAGNIEDGEGEFVAVDRFPFITAGQTISLEHMFVARGGLTS